MDPPPVQYVTTSDGYNIAYGVSGQGQPILIGLSTLNHVQLSWRYPGLQEWLEAMASRFRIIQLDPRGTGMSTRGLPEDVTVEDYLLDVEAVVEKLQLERFILYGAAPGSNIAIRYGLKHPERVAGLVLSGAMSASQNVRAPSLYLSVAEQDWDVFLHSIVPRDRSPEEVQRTVEILRQAWNQADLVLQMRATAHAPVQDILANLRLPALVLHPRDYMLVSPEEGMKVARLLGAQFRLIEGSNAFGDGQQALRAIEAFVAGLPKDGAASAPPAASLTLLSSREIDVLRLLAQGKSNAQIADELVISQNTVIRHVSNIFAKIGAENRTEAAAYAHRHGLT